MFKSYLLTALRHILKNRLYNMINIGGLAVGLSACIMILLYVDHELSYDQWIPENERVLRAEVDLNFEGSPASRSENMPPAIGPQMAEQLNEVELSTRLVVNHAALAYESFAFDQSVTLTDPSVFEMFGIELLEGDSETALNDPTSIVLNASDAQRLFVDGQALGKILKVNGEFSLKVTGVMPDWPNASDLDVKALVPYSSPIIDDQPWLRNSWGSFSGYTYIRIAKGVSVGELTSAYNMLARRIAPDWVYKDKEARNLPPVMDFLFTPAKDAHLKSEDKSGTRGSINGLWSASIVAFLILTIAVMNVTNLGTMLALKRVREVTIRKALGADAKQLVIQILTESMVLTVLALLIGLVIAEFMLPFFGTLMDRSLSTEALYTPSWLLVIGVGVVVSGCASGLYPAFVAAKFRPVDHLNGIKPSIGVRFRNFLMVAQFTATIGLLGTCFVVFQQAQYAQSRDPGFDSTQIFQVSGIQRPVVLENERSLRDSFARIEGVEAVAASHVAAGNGYYNSSTLSLEGDDNVQFRRIAVSREFFETMNMTALAGRLFSADRVSDYVVFGEDSRPTPIVINQTALERLGLASAQDAVNRILHGSENRQFTIIGVANDVAMGSARSDVRPSFYWVGPEEYRHIIMRVSFDNIEKTLSAIDDVWRDKFPDIPMNGQFIEEAFTEYYETERRRGWLLLGSAIVMIIISAVGLFALSALTTERRSREIVIRKVLGAKTSNIVNLLLWQFSKPILIANLVAWPIAWVVMQDWLESFVDRIALTPAPFLFASFLVIMISAVTVVVQSIATAIANPAKILRHE
ncbi:ABC transporter permease [Kordiimonas aquimaris]|uniref:ABC transporter permease n=1 Tax=Kordiimonas aquimaris TaxID=707591 RepID=UPI0021CE4E7E|nr:ABC transporter permease [Kordiimonas aquimaris]